jgi:hypothetical protein
MDSQMLGWVTWQAEPWNDSPNGVCQGPSTQEEIFADITVRQAFSIRFGTSFSRRDRFGR